jgi:hypothetical protein
MNYFLIENKPYASKKDLKESGYPNAVSITLAQYEFALANPNATESEVTAMQLNPAPEMTLEEAKALKISELQNAFNLETTETGVIDTGLGYDVRGRYADLINVMAIRTSLEINPDTPQFIFDTDGNAKPLTLAEANQIFKAFIAKGQELYLKLETLKATVNNKLKVSTVMAVKW